MSKVHPIKTEKKRLSDIAYYSERLRGYATSGDLRGIEDSIEKGADVRGEGDFAIRWAVVANNAELVRYLVENGADVHARDDEAFIRAISLGCLESAAALLDAGAKIDAKDNEAMRVAILADRKHQPDGYPIANWLLNQGATLDGFGIDRRQSIREQLEGFEQGGDDFAGALLEADRTRVESKNRPRVALG
jgi:hypothetical protein